MIGLETQASISRWAEETFGSAGTDFRVATRMNEEVAELLRAIAAGKPVDQILDEAADVAIVATRLADRLGVQFFAELESVVSMYQRQDCIIPVPACIAVEIQRAMTDAMYGCITDKAGRRGASVALLAVASYIGMLAYAFKSDIFEAIDRKMAINRGRDWRRDGTGHGYHVRPGSAAEARA